MDLRRFSYSSHFLSSHFFPFSTPQFCLLVTPIPRTASPSLPQISRRCSPLFDYYFSSYSSLLALCIVHLLFWLAIDTEVVPSGWIISLRANERSPSTFQQYTTSQASLHRLQGVGIRSVTSRKDRQIGTVRLHISTRTI